MLAALAASPFLPRAAQRDSAPHTPTHARTPSLNASSLDAHLLASVSRSQSDSVMDAAAKNKRRQRQVQRRVSFNEVVEVRFTFPATVYERTPVPVSQLTKQEVVDLLRFRYEMRRQTFELALRSETALQAARADANLNASSSSSSSSGSGSGSSTLATSTRSSRSSKDPSTTSTLDTPLRSASLLPPLDGPSVTTVTPASPTPRKPLSIDTHAATTPPVTHQTQAQAPSKASSMSPIDLVNPRTPSPPSVVRTDVIAASVSYGMNVNMNTLAPAKDLGVVVPAPVSQDGGGQSAAPSASLPIPVPPRPAPSRRPRVVLRDDPLPPSLPDSPPATPPDRFFPLAPAPADADTMQAQAQAHFIPDRRMSSSPPPDTDMVSVTSDPAEAAPGEEQENTTATAMLMLTPPAESRMRVVAKARVDARSAPDESLPSPPGTPNGYNDGTGPVESDAREVKQDQEQGEEQEQDETEPGVVFCPCDFCLARTHGDGSTTTTTDGGKSGPRVVYSPNVFPMEDELEFERNLDENAGAETCRAAARGCTGAGGAGAKAGLSEHPAMNADADGGADADTEEEVDTFSVESDPQADGMFLAPLRPAASSGPRGHTLPRLGLGSLGAFGWLKGRAGGKAGNHKRVDSEEGTWGAWRDDYSATSKVAMRLW
ncbi:hypothetical protein M427DRAFT_51346 [Gonapodya prolifera JEL478]|uniref:Uncharacterized protein n=1 Tax=Gonapodya prolifera (strain JEL478) TaxID=1344416 RepID=A0A139AZ46_GONPJ|nr:hypothetical protein M427DRAFT_51346 [Gonapodya prolifera JEL478]|eukprot:KXS21987.1 hypothetical protein M427DRAFT_51346 [Gonapodya prolifera JEL478]